MDETYFLNSNVFQKLGTKRKNDFGRKTVVGAASHAKFDRRGEAEDPGQCGVSALFRPGVPNTRTGADGKG